MSFKFEDNLIKLSPSP